MYFELFVQKNENYAENNKILWYNYMNMLLNFSLNVVMEIEK